MNMEQSKIQKLAKVLRVLVMIIFVCNLITLLLVPIMADNRYDLIFDKHFTLLDKLQHLLDLFAYDLDDGLGNLLGTYVVVWRQPYTGVLTVFLWACGICTAIILWQARRILNTIIAGRPFDPVNARSMTRAGICCLVISVAALGRLIWGFCTYKSIGPLLTYNALFIPVFAMAFLLCMVMSALFRQANELKEENDLTI